MTEYPLISSHDLCLLIFALLKLSVHILQADILRLVLLCGKKQKIKVRSFTRFQFPCYETARKNNEKGKICHVIMKTRLISYAKELKPILFGVSALN